MNARGALSTKLTAGSGWRCWSPKLKLKLKLRSAPRPVSASTSWDPEGLFNRSTPLSGIIERKLMDQRIETDKEYKSQVESFIATQKEEKEKRRQGRTPPTDPFDLVEYFLNTETEDMEFEVARCRPLMNEDFFNVITKLIGTERFSNLPDEERLAELETLRDYLTAAVDAVDKATAAWTAAPERLKKLLTSKDKKAMLLEMAGAGEIDQALMNLLEENIAGARAAGQQEAAEFMVKVQQAAQRYVIT
jgi:hypothetical protein